LNSLKTPAPKREETSDRIIAAAGAVFAERGFRGTTIRQITTRAGVNVAAVNYHFRDKGELYIRVLREAKRLAARIVVAELPGTPEERLCGFIQLFMRHLLDPERPAWHGRVLGQEMSNPTPALSVIIRELTAPLYRDVRGLIREILGATATPDELDLFTVSVFGQCVFYACGRPVVEQLALDLGRTPNRIARIAAHIGAFSVAGLHDFRGRHAGANPKRVRRTLALSKRP
jgi:AcrR family transcriptional regulator